MIPPRRFLNPLHNSCLATLAILFGVWLHPATAADPPGILNHQGRIAVNGTNFDGPGFFKFSLVKDVGGTEAILWHHDGTALGTAAPVGELNVSVSKGHYSILLGDATAPLSMTPIPASVFANNENVSLRIWFSTTSGSGFEQLAPDRRVASVGYALVAGMAETALTATTAITVAGAEPPETVFPAQGMVWIKPGKFLMGSRADEPGRGSDETQHWVTLTKGFWMGVHEVTQAEYVAVTGLANPSKFSSDTNRPVELVSWASAVAYCTALTTTERTAGRIPTDWEYRLPTEAEWEYCSRAGAQNSRFGYGDDLSASALSDYAWYSSNSSSTTHPVEQKRANAWGLMDMHGNVSEWCQDWYGAYPAGSATDPQGAASGSYRIIRGGSWNESFAFARCAKRVGSGPGGTSREIGFRVVLAPGQP